MQTWPILRHGDSEGGTPTLADLHGRWRTVTGCDSDGLRRIPSGQCRDRHNSVHILAAQVGLLAHPDQTCGPVSDQAVRFDRHPNRCRVPKPQTQQRDSGAQRPPKQAGHRRRHDGADEDEHRRRGHSSV